MFKNVVSLSFKLAMTTAHGFLSCALAQTVSAITAEAFVMCGDHLWTHHALRYRGRKETGTVILHCARQAEGYNCWVAAQAWSFTRKPPLHVRIFDPKTARSGCDALGSKPHRNDCDRGVTV